MKSSVIEVQGLSLTYQDGITALDGIDLEIPGGSSVCIAGPNGAGKSSLLMCLAGLLRFEGGILLAGREFTGIRAKGRDPSLFGLVFQDPDDQLFCTSVYDDVAFGPGNMGLAPEEVENRVRESLASVSLEGFEKRMPHHLSLGEKRKAAIAAVLACRPSILALDEPWAGLDARASRAVTGILSAFRGTRLVVTQDLRQAEAVCERFIILDAGRIVADGPASGILDNHELLEQHGLDFSLPTPVRSS